MFNKYYQDELTYLREAGREFVQDNPDAAPFLAERGSDPDVERLLEGFAFLTARIRQKLDDEFPEFTHGVMEMFWPQYLRPIPSMTIVQFEALPQAKREVRRIAAGSALDSAPVDGTRCRFRTAYDVTLTPFTLEHVELRLGTLPTLQLRLSLTEGVVLNKLNLKAVRLFLHGDPAASRALYLCLSRYLKRVVVKPASGPLRSFEAACVQPVGLRGGDLMLPAPTVSPEGYRLLHEYFAYPEKCLFVDLQGVDQWAAPDGNRNFEVNFELERVPDAMPTVGLANVLLHCTPAVNLFRHDGDPIRVDHERTEYHLRPAGPDATHREIYSIDRVTGLAKGTAIPREYRSFFGFTHSLARDDDFFFRTRLVPAVGVSGTQTFVTFVSATRGGPLPEVETIFTEITCTNRQLPATLAVGDLNVATDTSPEFARFKNITRPTRSVAPPLGGDIYWRLLSHVSLNYRSLASVDALRGILELYSFRAMEDRQAAQAHRRLLEAIKAVGSERLTRFIAGAPVRGVGISIELEETGFAGEGDLYLFAAVLNEFMSSYVTLNAFSQLTVKGTKYGEIHTWPPRLGGRTIL